MDRAGWGGWGVGAACRGARRALLRAALGRLAPAALAAWAGTRTARSQGLRDSTDVGQRARPRGRGARGDTGPPAAPQVLQDALDEGAAPSPRVWASLMVACGRAGQARRALRPAAHSALAAERSCDSACRVTLGSSLPRSTCLSDARPAAHLRKPEALLRSRLCQCSDSAPPCVDVCVLAVCLVLSTMVGNRELSTPESAWGTGGGGGRAVAAHGRGRRRAHARRARRTARRLPCSAAGRARAGVAGRGARGRCGARAARAAAACAGVAAAGVCSPGIHHGGIRAAVATQALGKIALCNTAPSR